MPHTSAAQATTFSLELVAPERELVSRDVGLVTVPGVEGDFGVLPGHAPFVSALRPGVVCVYDAGVVTERVFVSGGVAEVAGDHCLILAEDAQPLGELDAASLADDLATARAEADAPAVSEETRARALANVALLTAKQTALAQHTERQPPL